MNSNHTRTSSGMGVFSTVLIAVAGVVVSVLVTMQLKKMLEARSLSDRTEDMKEALKSAGASAADLKSAALMWINQKAQTVADSAQSTASTAANRMSDVTDAASDKMSDAISEIRLRSNG